MFSEAHYWMEKRKNAGSVGGDRSKTGDEASRIKEVTCGIEEKINMCNPQIKLILIMLN